MPRHSLYVERIAGASDAPVLVFLHHGLGSVAQWRDFPRRLAAATGCSALVYDRQGHGQSPPLDEPRSLRYHYEEAEVLRDLIEDEGITDFFLVGHSDGGNIALLYPALGARQPRGIITMAGHMSVEERTREGIRRTLWNWRETLHGKLRKYHGSKTDDLFLNWAGVWLSPSFGAFDISRELESVRCPVLAVQGADDIYCSEAQLQAMARLTGASVVLLPECGHDPHHEQTERTLESMSSWVESVRKSS